MPAHKLVNLSFVKILAEHIFLYIKYNYFSNLLLLISNIITVIFLQI